MVKRILSELPKLHELPAAGYGSYGWSGEAPDESTTKLLELNAKVVIEEPIKAKDYPGESILEDCRKLGVNLANHCQ